MSKTDAVIVDIEHNYSEFKYWFHRISQQTLMVESADGSDMEPIVINDGLNPTVDKDILEDFEKFKTRPEYLVGKLIPFEYDGEKADLLDLKSTYIKLLVGALLIKSNVYREDKEVISTTLSRINDMVGWLQGTDFFYAPASTHYHDAYEGGLLEHTLRVYNNIIKMYNVDVFGRVPLFSATISSLCHDWCKIGVYAKYLRNVKNEETGQWEKQDAYKYDPKGVQLGHGVSSIYIVTRFIPLTLEEYAAIRWHMGRWNVSEEEMNDLQSCNEKFPLVHMLQFADQLSITEYN